MFRNPNFEDHGLAKKDIDVTNLAHVTDLVDTPASPCMSMMGNKAELNSVHHNA